MEGLKKKSNNKTQEKKGMMIIPHGFYMNPNALSRRE